MRGVKRRICAWLATTASIVFIVSRVISCADAEFNQFPIYNDDLSCEVYVDDVKVISRGSLGMYQFPIEQDSYLVVVNAKAGRFQKRIFPRFSDNSANIAIKPNEVQFNVKSEPAR